jgi:elongator complex protein 4
LDSEVSLACRWSSEDVCIQRYGAEIMKCNTTSLILDPADPTLTALFPQHHGLIEVLSAPTPHSLLPASDRLSTLRGLACASGLSMGGGENNLAFRCTRKRLIIETLHLDVEGGVGERRTNPAPTLGETHGPSTEKARARANVAVELEVERTSGATTERRGNGDGETETEALPALAAIKAKVGKTKRKVQFQSERPELFDF